MKRLLRNVMEELPLELRIAILVIGLAIALWSFMRFIRTGGLKRHDTFLGFARRGLSVILEHPLIAFGAIFLLAMLDATILRSVFSFFNINDFESLQAQGAMGKNSAMVKVILTYTGINILKIVLLGPFFAFLVKGPVSANTN